MEKPSNPKIFFTDLDGTLLTTDKRITPATMDALRQWTEAGNKLALSSGRAIESVNHVRATLGLDFPGMYLIGCNGSEIYDCDSDTVIFRVGLTFPQTSLIMETARKQGVHCHTYTDTHIISPADSEELHYYRRGILTPVIICEDVLSALDKEPCKCIAIEIHEKEKLEHFRQTLLPLVKGEVSLLYSNDQYLEIFPGSAGKGSAIQKLCSLINIPLSRTLAAGDEANDISMLQAAGIGIAMSNAKDYVKENADLITETDNDHDGLAPILLQYK